LERLAKLQSEKHFEVRILAPVSDDIGDRTGRRKLSRALKGRNENEEREGVEWRKIEPLNVTFFVFDRSKMFMTQYSDLGAERTEEEAALSNIYSTNRHTIAGIVSIFEALWRESELVEKEISSRRRAELLQDILTHDIRNYNQVARLSAELITEEAKDERVVRELSDSLLKAIDGSSQLVERAKKLGKILTEGAPNLYPVDVVSEIDSSFQLVQRAHPDKEIHHDLRIGGEANNPKMGGKTWPVSPTVLADDMLHEVFDNIYSNAVKYTDSGEVNIETRVEDDSLNWKICICDQGRGIPEEQKNGVFTRYLKSAKGSGLGMSIVYALVVDRYGGRIELKNRVSGDYTKGTLVEIWLPKHSPST
jgi:signal transduction histidine kinase